MIIKVLHSCVSAIYYYFIIIVAAFCIPHYVHLKCNLKVLLLKMLCKCFSLTGFVKGPLD